MDSKLVPTDSLLEKDHKKLKCLIQKAIEENDLAILDQLLINETNKRILLQEKHFDPFVIAIKANNLALFEYLYHKGFVLEGSSMGSKSISSFNCKKFKSEEKIKDSPTVDSINNNNYNNYEKNANRSYSNALIEAIKCLNLKAIELLIRLNIDVNSSNYKNVPLQISYNIYSNEREKYLYKHKNFNKYRLHVST